MLELSEQSLIGRGLHRECYQHPQRHDRCIKVIVHGDSDENSREARYLSFLERRGSSLAQLTRFHGVVTTSRGEGAVFDLVRDHDGSIAKSLAHYLGDHAFCQNNVDNLRAALADLYRYLLVNGIITMTIKAKNILYRRQDASPGRLVIVDNIGNADFIPIANYVAALARAKIRRKWSRFMDDLRMEHRDNPSLDHILSG